MSEISWYQCHLFYLLLLLLILCQETQCTKTCESSILARISGGFLLSSNSNVLPMNSMWPLQLHAKGACSLPLPVLVLCWRSDAHASVDGTLSSHPAVHEFDRVEGKHICHHFIFSFFETMTMVLTKDSSLS